MTTSGLEVTPFGSSSSLELDSLNYSALLLSEPTLLDRIVITEGAFSILFFLSTFAFLFGPRLGWPSIAFSFLFSSS